MLTTIEVRAEHVRDGKRFECGFCPVALAIKERLAPGSGVTVTGNWVYLRVRASGASSFHQKRLPDAVALAIGVFDETGLMEPFAFPLDIPAEALKEETCPG